MSPNTVHVKNISAQTSEKEIKEFFSFCGKITDIDVKEVGETKEATVTFEKATAAKTALLLDHTQLGSTQVSVSSEDTTDETEHYTHNSDRDTDEITQEEKPRSRIIAEYLAHGYVISDHAAQRAIALDQKRQLSNMIALRECSNRRGPVFRLFEFQCDSSDILTKLRNLLH